MSLNLDRSAWQRVSLGELVANVNNYYRPEADGVLPYVSGPHINPGEVTVVAYGSTDDDKFPPTFKRKFDKGDVLLHSRGIEKLAAVDRVGVTGEKLFVLRTKDSRKLKQEFLVWLLLGPAAQAHMRDNFTGSVNKFLNWKPLAAMELLLPPLDEQNRIADLLWAVERHRLALASLMSRTKAAATVLIEDVRRRVPETKAVGEVARVHNGQTFPKELQGKTTGEVAFFKVADLDGVGNARFLTNPGNWISESDMERLSAQLLPKGTVVTARVGAAIKLERRRALRWPALVDDNHLVIRPLSDSVDPDYLLAVLSETALSVNGNDGVVPSLNQRIVGAVPLPAVARHHQQQIGASYQRILDARDELGAELDALVRLRSSLLDGTFGGD